MVGFRASLSGYAAPRHEVKIPTSRKRSETLRLRSGQAWGTPLPHLANRYRIFSGGTALAVLGFYR